MQRDESSVSPIITAMHRVNIEEIICVLLLSFFAMQGAIPGISPNQASEMTNTASTGLMKVVGIGSQVIADSAICVLAIMHFQRLRRLVFSLQWSAAIAVLAVLSTLWSQDPAITARRSVPFVLATIFGLYLASRFPVQRQLSIFCSTMLLAALATIALALLLPSVGLEASTGHYGNWQGVFTQKNACGRAMVFATAALLARRRMNIIHCVWLSIFLLVLVMSGSRGAWAIEVVILLCDAPIRGLERFSVSSRKVLLCIAALLVVCIAAIMWSYFPLLATALGRDATLTGRTTIWQQVWSAIVKHPIMGYGFCAFWQGMKGESYNVILALRFVIFHAHNGFLEIWLELGAVGLFLFGLSYVRAWRNLWPMVRSPQVAGSSWMIFMLVLTALYDLDENSLLVFNGLFWILYVSTLANIEILAKEQKKYRGLRKQWTSESNSTVTCPVT
jgi:exopolysaccharide production protein ExoQ